MSPAYSWELSPQVAGLAILAASEVPNFLAGALPSFMTIGRFASSPEDVERLRDGERWGVVPIVGVGVGATMISRNWWPALMCALVLVWYLIGYERHIRNPSDGARPINAQG